MSSKVYSNFRIPRYPVVQNPFVKPLEHYEPKPPKPRPLQHWSAYNEAQSHEIEIFDELLRELVATVEEPERPPCTGRKPLPLSDQLYCSIEKIYSQLSSRRAKSLYDKAEGRGQLSHSPHFNAVSKFLNREDITPILQDLVRQSAIPLAGIESDFAVDSTGFRTSTFGRYCEDKHKVKRERHYLKAHICSGVNTNVVTAAIITDEYGGDCPQLAPLLIKTAEDFAISEVSADKAYLSRENYTLIGSLGGEAFIPFKKNSTGKAKGSPLWKRAYHFVQMHEDEFNEHYHKRSNVETTIGAIKRKFGETLKSKNQIAQENELLCKIIAYNITVLIHQMYESGIYPMFSLEVSGNQTPNTP